MSLWSKLKEWNWDFPFSPCGPSKLDKAEAEIVRLKRSVTDGVYMNQALVNMLGPKGKEVVAIWNSRKVQRVHYSWGPDAHKMTGEERAAYIVDMETKYLASKRIETLDGDLHD